MLNGCKEMRGKPPKSLQFCHQMCSKNGGTDRMYKKKDRETGELFSEFFPFGGRLDVGNRWLKISELVPWDELERYVFSEVCGQPQNGWLLFLLKLQR